MVKGQIALAGAVLAAKFVPQKKIKAREGHALLGFHIVFKDNDRWYAELLPLAAHHMVIFGHDLHPVKYRRLDRLLPGPQRQGVVTKRSIIGIQDQRRKMLQRSGIAYKLCPEVAVHSPRYPRQLTVISLYLGFVSRQAPDMRQISPQISRKNDKGPGLPGPLVDLPLRSVRGVHGTPGQHPHQIGAISGRSV